MRIIAGLIFLLLSVLGAQAQGCGPQNPNCIVPTAPPGTNNNQAASTAFVQAAAVAPVPIDPNYVLAGPATGVTPGVPAGRALVGADLPVPSSSTLGGVESITCATHEWLNTISVAGVPACAQPATTDISGLGTIATQNANAVVLTGGTITGLPTPSGASDAATKQYVDNSAVGLVVHAQVSLATAAALPANTYNNGTAGVGATLTGNSNGALTVDGVLTTSSIRVVVKTEAAPAHNGIYVVTTVGDGSNPYVLTRATDANTPGTGNPLEIGLGSYVFVTAGTANGNTGWSVNSTVTTIGTDAIVWAQFSSSAPVTVSNSDGSLTISPTSGNIVASLNEAHNNTFIAQQTISSDGGGLVINDPPPQATAGRIFFENASAIYWTISSGLGLTSYGLDIYDNIAGRNDLQIASNGNMQLMPNGGGVGIGTAPSSLLDVNGTFHATGAATFSNSAAIAGNAIVGGGDPWVDVKSGANGCAAAVGNGSTNDYSAISCQISYMETTYSGGIVFFPCGTYITLSTLTITAPVILVGSGVGCTTISTGNTDITGVLYSSSTQQHWGGLRDLQVAGYENTAATAMAVEVDNFVNLTFSDFQIIGGNFGLYVCGTCGSSGGGDNTYRNGFICGSATNGGCINSENGSNWFYDIKADNVGGNVTYSVYLHTDSGLSGVSENSFWRTDMSGNFSGGSLAINDSGTDRSTVVMFHPIMGGSGGFGALGTFRHLSLNGCECGSGTVNISNGNLTVVGSMAGNGGGGSVVFSGTGTRSCAGNIGISC